MRDVEDRIEWYRTHLPMAVGRCAEHVKNALNAPLIHAASATIAYGKVPPVQVHRDAYAPRGTILYWTGGVNGYGHVAISLGGGDVLSVDVNGPRTVGVKPFSWFAANWPRLIYKGWSWYWGPLDTQPKESTVATWPAVGSKKVIEIPSVTLTPSRYTVVGRITLPPGEYILTLQGRLPEKSYARVQFVRVGWGDDPDGRDETGSTPWTPPDALATSYSHSHPLSGGGPVEYEIKIVGGTSAKNVVVKATRVA